MSEAERQEYVNSNPCPECGLPIAACNKIALQRIDIKELKAALAETLKGYVETQYYDLEIVARARAVLERTPR